MILGVALIAGLFFNDNAVFFQTVEQNRKDGMEWHYIGKTTPDGSPAITAKNEATGEEFIYFKMKQPQEQKCCEAQ